MKLFKSKKKENQLNFLELTPIQKFEHFENEENIITIKIPKFQNSSISKFLIPKTKSEFIHVKLDKIGSMVWKSITGENNVASICEKMVENTSENSEDLQMRITQYLTILHKQRLIKYKELNES